MNIQEIRKLCDYINECVNGILFDVNENKANKIEVRIYTHDDYHGSIISPKQLEDLSCLIEDLTHAMKGIK